MISTEHRRLTGIRGKREHGPVRRAILLVLYGVIVAGVLGIVVVLLGTIGWMFSRGQARPAPTPTSTPSTASQAQVQSYLNTATQTVGRGTTAQMQVISQLELIVGKPTVAMTPGWRSPTSSAVSSLRRAGQELQNLQPVPNKAVELNRRMIMIGGDMVSNADEYTAFMNGEEPQHLDIAARRMAVMNSRIEEALPLIKALHEGR